MTEREALKLALEALEDLAYWDNGKPEYHEANKAITAIKEALAQPEQEQQIETLKRCLFQMQEAAKDLVEQAKSLTPPQRTWVGLTDEEFQYCVELKNPESIAEEVEAKLKEKNT